MFLDPYGLMNERIISALKCQHSCSQPTCLCVAYLKVPVSLKVIHAQTLYCRNYIHGGFYQ
jgi:hypothetical protein